jgi:hypothetical protein
MQSLVLLIFWVLSISIKTSWFTLIGLPYHAPTSQKIVMVRAIKWVVCSPWGVDRVQGLPSTEGRGGFHSKIHLEVGE